MSKFSSYTGCTDSLIFSRNNRLIINNIKKKIFDHLKTLYIFILLGKNLLPKKKKHQRFGIFSFYSIYPLQKSSSFKINTCTKFLCRNFDLIKSKF